MDKGNNIVLIGMPGAGKSTMGVVLAKVLGYQFIDTDLIIQHEENRLLRDIILEQGLEEFIQIENRVNKNLAAKRSVIATGGSVIYGEEAMHHLGCIGTIIYLKLSYPTIHNRLGNIKKRGVVLKEGQSLFELYLERISLYEKYAEIEIDCEEKDIEQVVAEIVRAMETK